MFKGTLIPPGLVSHQPGLTTVEVPLHLHSEGQSFTWKKFTPNNAHVAGFNRSWSRAAPNRLHHFLGEGSTDYQGFKFKQTTKEGKY